MHQKCSRSFLIGPSNLSSASSFSSSTTSDGRYGTRSHRPLQCTAACRLLPPSLRSRLRDALMLHIRHPTHPPTVHKTHRRRKARLHAHPHPRAARARKSTADNTPIFVHTRPRLITVKSYTSQTRALERSVIAGAASPVRVDPHAEATARGCWEGIAHPHKRACART